MSVGIGFSDCLVCLHSADQALDRFAMKRFYEDKIVPIGQPSQRRWVPGTRPSVCTPDGGDWPCTLLGRGGHPLN